MARELNGKQHGYLRVPRGSSTPYVQGLLHCKHHKSKKGRNLCFIHKAWRALRLLEELEGKRSGERKATVPTKRWPENAPIASIRESSEVGTAPGSAKSFCEPNPKGWEDRRQRGGCLEGQRGS